MTTTLKLHTTNSIFPDKKIEFPGDEYGQACLADYKYSATRMSSAPNITATLKWPRCLDNEWSTNVFVDYNGERFFVKNTPSSSYDNTSCLYSHSLELVSERAILDSVYFLNVPTTTSGEGENPQGDSLSDSTEFTFPGDIHEFVDRLNKSLNKSGVGGRGGYSAVVDNGATSDTKLFSISNQYVTDVLKSAYELYEVPYYFVGKVIHFGNQQNIINTPPLEYGADNSLLSISKSNSNKQVVTRITGYGSSRNIPYYYPNPTPKGILKLTGRSSSKYIIADQMKFASYIDIDKPIIYRNVRSTSTSIDLDEESLYKKVTLSDVTSGIIYQASLDNGFYKIEFDGWTSGTSYVHPFVPLEICRGYLNYLSWDGIFLEGYAEHNGKRVKIVNRDDSQYPYFVLKYETSFPQSKYAKHVIYFRWTDGPKNIMFSGYRSSLAEETARLSNLTLKRADTSTFQTTLEVTSSYSGPGHVYYKPTMKVNGVEVSDTISHFIEGEVIYEKTGDRKSYTRVVDGMLYFGKLEAGVYIVRNSFAISSNETLRSTSISYEEVPYSFWEYSVSKKEIDFSKTGLALAEGAEMQLSDLITQTTEYRIDVKNNLMPSEYRRKLGKNMWYNATNSANRGEWYGDIVFDNVYDSRHPVEYIYTDEEIYPTITGMKNGEGENIDTFLDIAFDRDDNNEIYPEDYEDEKLAGKYKHPYFFVKLKKTDGPNGFNLFDHAIEGETMKISFTTGHVAGCEFEIGVDEETQKNPVQVDANGDLVIDNSTGNVIVSGDYIPEQQDTQNNEVWIALKKEDSTMGVMMPDTASQLVPLGDLLPTGDKREGGGDKFVILGIHLPKAYITAAEDRLEQELIKYLKENNRERFSFSLKLSSIYLAENPEFANNLNENSRVTLIYNGVPYTMYVTSYSVTVKESSALPEVTISINDELKVVRPKVKDVSLFIDSTDTKIKNVRKTIQNTNESIKTLSEDSNSISNQLNALIGDDAWMSAREIAEDVSNPIDERVSILIGTDANKSARTIATEVLAGASTGGDIDLSLYLSKSEAESTYATKKSLETTNDSIDSIATRLGETFETLDSVITGINTTATNALTKATEVEAEVDNLAKDVESNTKTIAEHTKTIAEHTEIVTMLNNRCDSIEDTADELESQISQIETNVTSLDEHIDEVEEKANNASAQASELAGIVTENTNKIDILVGTDNNTSVRAIANNAIDQKTILLEDAATSQDDNDDGLVTAKDAVTYFASKSYVNRDVNRIDGEIAGIEASMSDLEEDIKNVENTLGTLNTAITQVSKKTDNAVSQAESATTKADEAKTTATEAKTTANNVSAQMSGVLTQVQNNTTQIGIIAKDYLRKDQAADFATDLTGVVEATAEEFVYRPSAGEKSIRDKSAVIRRIKGNSVVWEQKLKSPSDENANWQGYSSSMLTTEIQGREMRCTLTGASVATNPYQVGITGILPSGSVGGHKYLFCAWVKVSYLNSSLGNTFAFEHDWNTWTLYPAISEVDKWTFVSRIWESPQNNNRTSTIRPPWAYTSANGAKAGDWYAIKDAMFFDLTAMIGAGNEPATVEEFRKVYNEAYYPYCQPELRGVKTGAIKTVGFNLFDGECARVIGGMSYIVSNYAAAYYSDTKDGTQTKVSIEGGVYTPECSGYLYLEGSADATPCVHFQHSGVMDGECAPYVEHILNLPEILKLFPNGMHGLRNTYHDVYDEINIDNYIKRLEIVDLGSLWWNSDSSRQCFHAPLNTHKVRGIALCTRYTCTTLGGISDKQLSTHNYYGNTRIFIKDVDFDNPTDFMASLQGVYLVYELNEPIITPLSEPIALDYYCEDWGSEEAIPASSASAPFRADIVYQFNAEGRIRDNSRNIDKLEKIVRPLKNIPSRASLATQDFVLANIPTLAATATERVVVTVGDEKQNLLPNGDEVQYLLPNMLYDYGATSYDEIELPNLLRGDVAFNNKWMVRFASISSDAISIPFDVFWKDGIAPSWSAWGVCEMTFFKDAEGFYTFGEWKIYK